MPLELRLPAGVMTCGADNRLPQEVGLVRISCLDSNDIHKGRDRKDCVSNAGLTISWRRLQPVPLVNVSPGSEEGNMVLQRGPRAVSFTQHTQGLRTPGCESGNHTMRHEEIQARRR